MVAAQRQADNALRRVAILLNNLDAENRRRLLAHFPAAEASRLRSAAASLTDVDPLEVRRVVTAFMGRISVVQNEAVTAETQAPQVAAAEGSTNSKQKANQLDFLSQCSDVTLLKAVESEHPQTIAVVLASLQSEQAARLLKALPENLRIEAIRRLGRLDEIPQEVLDDVGRHLKSLVGNLEPLMSSESRRTLTSILAAFGDGERESLVGSLANSDGLIASALADIQRTALSVGAANVGGGPGITGPTARSEMSLPEQRGAAENGNIQRNAQSNTQNSATANDANYRRLESPSDRSTAEVDLLLESLPPRDLQVVLAALDAREALLTLCGLSNQAVKRLLRSLPRRQSKAIQARMTQMGAMDFHEIESAKRSAVAYLERYSETASYPVGDFVSQRRAA